MSDSKEQIAFRGTAEYKKILQQAALDRGLKVQSLLEQAVERYLRDADEGTKQAPTTPEGEPSTITVVLPANLTDDMASRLRDVIGDLVRLYSTDRLSLIELTERTARTMASEAERDESRGIKDPNDTDTRKRDNEGRVKGSVGAGKPVQINKKAV